MSLDFDRIRRDYPLPEIVSASGEKVEKNGSEWALCCPFHGENTPSFTIYRDKSSVWKFHCFGCGVHGDNIDYVKERYNVETGEAARIITGENRDRSPVDKREYRESTNPYDGYEVGRPPADTPPLEPGVKTPPILNPKRVDQNKMLQRTYMPNQLAAVRTADEARRKGRRALSEERNKPRKLKLTSGQS